MLTCKLDAAAAVHGCPCTFSLLRLFHVSSHLAAAVAAALPCCRLQRVLLSQQGTVSDADLATWMQPLLFMATDSP
jgi:hypothetical protein